MRLPGMTPQPALQMLPSLPPPPPCGNFSAPSVAPATYFSAADAGLHAPPHAAEGAPACRPSKPDQKGKTVKNEKAWSARRTAFSSCRHGETSRQDGFPGTPSPSHLTPALRRALPRTPPRSDKKCPSNLFCSENLINFSSYLIEFYKKIILHQGTKAGRTKNNS